jgi:hypothetical protein
VTDVSEANEQHNQKCSATHLFDLISSNSDESKKLPEDGRPLTAETCRNLYIE